MDILGTVALTNATTHWSCILLYAPGLVKNIYNYINIFYYYSCVPIPLAIYWPYFSLTGSGSLMMKVVGVVRVAEEADNNTFEYAVGETSASLWPGR